jgi:methyltransferase-like protein
VSRPRPKISAAQLKRPTLDTKFHIDFGWWDQSDLDLKTYLFSRLEIGDDSSIELGVENVDLVDPDTAEVRQVDSFQFAMQTYFSQLPDDFVKHSSLVDAVFYVLLANANKPMSAQELAERVQRDPDTVLKTISGTRIYQGIRPIFNGDE